MSTLSTYEPEQGKGQEGRVGCADQAGQASPGAAKASPPSGDHPSRGELYRRPVYFFDKPGMTEFITLADGFRMVIFVPGHAPSIVPITEPGRYEMSPELLPDGEWPICVSTVDAAHAHIFAQWPPEKTTEMVASIAAYYRDSNGSQEGGDGVAGSVACDDSAGPKGIA